MKHHLEIGPERRRVDLARVEIPVGAILAAVALIVGIGGFVILIRDSI